MLVLKIHVQVVNNEGVYAWLLVGHIKIEDMVIYGKFEVAEQLSLYLKEAAKGRMFST